MDRSSFLRLAARRVFPMLRSEGFVGSGATLRRISGPVLHVINLQGNSAGAEFYVNLGATLTFLGMHGVDESNVATAKEYQCVFRHRLHPPSAAGRAWYYGDDEDAAAKMLEWLVDEWKTEGRSWFQRYASYPDDFRREVESPSAMTLHPAHMLTFARIALQLGDRRRCFELAREALAKLPEGSAVMLRQELSDLLALGGRD